MSTRPLLTDPRRFRNKNRRHGFRTALIGTLKPDDASMSSHPSLRVAAGLGQPWCQVLVALLVSSLVAQAAVSPLAPPTNATPHASDRPWPDHPLSLGECLNTALQQNPSILQSQQDLKAAEGIVVQTRAIALPKLQSTGQYGYSDQLESLRLQDRAIELQRDHSWSAGIRLVQSLYEGGRIQSSLRTARLTREQALLSHQAVVMDVVLLVRVAFDDVLMTAEQIVVENAAQELLRKELEDTTRRYNAGTVPQFNVLRSEVELANAQPRLFQARNAHRIAKNHLAHLLGYRVPPGVWEDIPLKLTGVLDAAPYAVDLPQAISEALLHRPELAILRKTRSLREEGVTTARAGYLPSVQLFGGYGWRSSSFQDDLMADVAGWNAGAQLTWNWFDGLMTRGKVMEAKASLERARIEVEDRTRQVELEVRTAYSAFVEAREVLESQKKVIEQAQEALRLASARDEAGTGTQLDVLNAQTALTQARTTHVRALRDYSVARARLERAMGRGWPEATAGPLPASP